jgi:hypothetical protein
MNRRLYFMLPDTESAHAMMNDLLLARVNSNRIHFLAKPGVEIGDLPAASIVERTDFLEGWEIGTLLGGLLGLVAGLMAVWIPPWPFENPVPLLAIPICIVVGLVAGGLWTGMVASAIPDHRLKPFEGEIAMGKVLMMVLIPFHRVEEIRALVVKKHPEAVYDGTWPSEHVIFP